MTKTISPISELIWKTRYLHNGELNIEASWRRVAHALASVEQARQKYWEDQFLKILKEFQFLPGGRILAGAGSDHEVTLFNCFVMGHIDDDMESIFNALKEGALTMQQGGGVGYDFSSLRPAGSRTTRVGGSASGPVSFMRIWNTMCDTLLSTSNRRGAMMGTLRCDHPDIETFVEAKRQAGELRNFNLSVLVSEAFMQAIESDDSWPLVFPTKGLSPEDRKRYQERIERCWYKTGQPISCAVLKRVSARQLWRRIMRASYDAAEPGVLFVDQIQQMNNLNYRERISATNPCGEVPLPAYGVCDLGSINLTAFVINPFSDDARLDLEAILKLTTIATRMLDNVIDLSRYPLPQQREQAHGSRRIGLGITGLADALIMLKLDYRSEKARKKTAEIMRTICHAAYRASIELAREKQVFPFLQLDAYLASPFIQGLPANIRDGIAAQGIRNSHLTAIAPAGSISLLADNISSGIEPVFEFVHRRLVKNKTGEAMWYSLTDQAMRHWRQQHSNADPPNYFVCASDLTPEEHLTMQSAVQTYVDNAVSKTVNVPSEITFDQFKSIYELAWRLGLKGCTAFRPNPVTGSVLSPEPIAESCCCPPSRTC